MLVRTFASAVFGIGAITIQVEVQITDGVGYFLSGLPDSAIKESQQRIISALISLGYRWPGKRIVINLAPADIRKEGAAYDLPLAMGVLGASDKVNSGGFARFVMMGELALDGSLRPVKGVLPIAMRAREDGFAALIVPAENAREAAVVEGIDVYGMNSLSEVIDLFNGSISPEPVRIDIREEFNRQLDRQELDFSDVRGQESVKRALEVAVAGGHNLLLVGPPGAGKTMLAQRLPGIIPPMTPEEALETTKIHSVAGKLGARGGLITRRPFRSPHHTISDVALVGGGSYPQPGEISLAHHGVLFLDELPEFKRSVLEVMRQPLEDRFINISRTRFTIQYPASFMLVASMNPCQCGYYNHPDKQCTCSNGSVQKYLSRVSGPLLDRIDLHIEVVPVKYDKLAEIPSGETSATIRERISRARIIQEQRFDQQPGTYCNAQMGSRQMRKFCRINDAGKAIMKQAMERLGLSARAYDRILKVSRTIADLEGSQEIEVHQLAEAVNYRSLDRDIWGG
ncbi:MAG: YifB family Mg chelatase-like AAA ATPase [Bacteroidales bacterium]